MLEGWKNRDNCISFQGCQRFFFSSPCFAPSCAYWLWHIRPGWAASTSALTTTNTDVHQSCIELSFYDALRSKCKHSLIWKIQESQQSNFVKRSLSTALHYILDLHCSSLLTCIYVNYTVSQIWLITSALSLSECVAELGALELGLKCATFLRPLPEDDMAILGHFNCDITERDVTLITEVIAQKTGVFRMFRRTFHVCVTNGVGGETQLVKRCWDFIDPLPQPWTYREWQKGGKSWHLSTFIFNRLNSWAEQEYSGKKKCHTLSVSRPKIGTDKCLCHTYNVSQFQMASPQISQERSRHSYFSETVL